MRINVNAKADDAFPFDKGEIWGLHEFNQQRARKATRGRLLEAIAAGCDSKTGKFR